MIEAVSAGALEAAGTDTASADRSASPHVLRFAALDRAEVEALLRDYGVRLVEVRAGLAIPGSYWGDAEAGLVGNAIYVRADTPAHSLLHELCHYICMDSARRVALATDAGGTDDEECGVCYLEVLLADRVTGFGRERCLDDMDAWGYSFREGTVRDWLAGDGAFARQWLFAHGLVDAADRPTLRLR